MVEEFLDMTVFIDVQFIATDFFSDILIQLNVLFTLSVIFFINFLI